jgi:hypothetical protein
MSASDPGGQALALSGSFSLLDDLTQTTMSQMNEATNAASKEDEILQLKIFAISEFSNEFSSFDTFNAADVAGFPTSAVSPAPNSGNSHHLSLPSSLVSADDLMAQTSTALSAPPANERSEAGAAHPPHRRDSAASFALSAASPSASAVRGGFVDSQTSEVSHLSIYPSIYLSIYLALCCQLACVLHWSYSSLR